MMRNLRRSKLFILLLTLLMLACLSLPALAEEENTSSGSQVIAQEMSAEEQDLLNAVLYTRYYSFYDLDADVFDVADTQELMSRLQKVDKWARYYDPESFAAYTESLEGQKCGIGIYYLIEDGYVHITGIIPGGAAEKAGLVENDLIISVDGKPIADMNEVEVKQSFAGEEGKHISVKLNRSGQELSFDLVLAPFELRSVQYEMLSDGIALVRISQFTEQTGNELQSIYYEIMSLGARGMILDLRNCPGGTMNSAIDVISMLTDAENTLFLQYKSSFSYFGRSKVQQILLPMVTLVNENTASAAELLSGTLQDTGRSVLIGTKTYGKGLMQNVFFLPSGAGICLTSATYLTTGWQNVDKQGGIEPDIYVAEPDAQLQKAVQMIKLQNASASMLILKYGSHEVLADACYDMYFEHAPYCLEGVSYLPLRETLTALGYEVFYYDGVLYLRCGTQLCVVDLAASKATLGKISYPAELRMDNSTVYASSAFFRMLCIKPIWQQNDGCLLLCK